MNKRIVYRQNQKDVISELIDGEMVILNVADGNYYTLDGLGVIMWDLIQKSGNPEKITACIQRLYNNSIDRDKVRNVLLEFMNELVSHGLLLRVTEDTSSNDKAELASGFKGQLQVFKRPVLRTYREIQEKYTHPAGIKRSDDYEER